MHPALLAGMRRQPAYRAVHERLPQPGAALNVANLPASSCSLLLATLAADLPQRVWVAIAHSPQDADAIEADLQSLLESGTAVLFPQRETLPYEAAEHHLEVGGLRVEAIEALLSGRSRILVTTARALQELAEIPTELAELRLTIRAGETPRLQDLEERLSAMGFDRATLVEAVGEYAVRGGIVDLFGFGAPDPVRIELWGDEVASIRSFDILDQRSTAELKQVDILPVDLTSAARGSNGSSRRSLLDVLTTDAILVELSAGASARDFERTWEQVLHLHDAEHRRGADPEPPATLFLPPATAAERMAQFGRILVAGDPASAAADGVRFDIRDAEPIERDMDRLSTLLRIAAARSEETYILCDNAGQLDRLEELIGSKAGIPPGTTLALGAVAAGFVLEGADPPLRVLTDHEIFRRERRLRRARRFRGAVALESLSQLRPGDFVVHLEHGVGRFRGLKHVVVGGVDIESLEIEYASGEILRLPVYRLDLIERWSSDREDAEPPKLHKIGGKTWKNLRTKTEKAIQEMASELLQLYAQRQLAERPPYPSDTRWQKELESSFLYDDTPDQRQATADVKRDMESRRPMDRLLCGDVGYGKTEIAVRAAFKSAEDGRQVAVLAPTTILVEQHMQTFRQRIAGYPIRVESISRFRTPREQEQIIEQLEKGEIDIIIGTHRLLEPDVKFSNLGLLVIDEEQRFGVKQKERLKDLKTQLDVLSLTATPIPRTLHFSLTGLRDLSLLQTAPRDRMPVITHVLPWVDEVIEDAILRELDRGGQVFFMHNRVQSIHIVSENVRRLVPHARIGVAHGQMTGPELEEVMHQFIAGDLDILVTTAIIENGLDVPNANTLIVDRADQFGLAQLYQIRGRVGRSHHRAYCYLLTPEGITDDAEKRLRILEHYTELGSGYAIAMKDLEMRGAGNLLGGEQSGFVTAVGLDTYTRLLEDTIKRLKGQKPAEDVAPTDVAIEGAAFLPDDYVRDAAQKLHLYRRLSRVETVLEVSTIHAEVRDRYGPHPPEVERLFVAARLRLLGTQLGVERILVQGDAARVTFRAGTNPRLAVLQNAFRDHQVAVEIRRPVPLSFVIRRHGARDIAETLSAALEALAADRR
ncbi:MAG TPA: transcription-repair coupling factor [Longimicrobiales bacterium]